VPINHSPGVRVAARPFSTAAARRPEIPLSLRRWNAISYLQHILFHLADAAIFMLIPKPEIRSSYWWRKLCAVTDGLIAKNKARLRLNDQRAPVRHNSSPKIIRSFFIVQLFPSNGIVVN